MSRMKALQALVLIFVVLQSEQSYVAPTWTVNALMNSGQAKPANWYTGIGTAPSTFSINQPFNATFGATPRVVLGLLGYKQNGPCGGCNVGFKIAITSITSSQYSSTVTIYGANMLILHYFYLGISTTAVQFSIDYQCLQFATGNLVNASSSSRQLTNINNNVAGESYPNYASHQIANIIYLAGYQMNVGNTGIYINLTTAIINSTYHSVTIATTADVQIYQVTYFRISFDVTTYMAGYIYVVDLITFYGFNNIQQIYTSTITASSMQYRNQIMGFNKIYIAGSSPVPDINIAGYLTWQTLWTTASEATPPVFTNATFAHLSADVFHNRKRVCPTPQPYFHLPNLLCYDICPDTYYPASTPAYYCEVCHYSCYTCTGGTNLNCSTCPANSNRTYNSPSTSCPCNNNYFDNGVSLCAICAYPCVTCITSNTTCTSCDITQHRVLNITSNICQCDNGYFQQLVNSTYICSACISTCITCVNNNNYCLTCDSLTQHRVLNATTNICQCSNGYYQTSVNTPTICLSCDVTCVTCHTSATYCLSCDNINQHRILNATNNVCICNNGYYQTSTNTPSTCLSCHPTCITCMLSSTYCTSCDNVNQYRTLNTTNNICVCSDGYYQTSTNSPTVCLSCSSTCLTCLSSSTHCTSCDNVNQYRILNTTTNICQCNNGYYQTSANTPTICLSCDATCVSCVSLANYCIACDNVNQYRVLNITNHLCQCSNGYYQTSTNTPTICLSCNPTCITCASSSSYCLSCDSGNHHRTLNTTTNICACSIGYYQTSVNNPTVCLSCDVTCPTCSSSATYCLSCLPSQHRTLNTSTNACTCDSGYYQTSTNSPAICLSCSPTCLTCSSSASYCTSCDSSLHRTLSNNKCVCDNGYYQDIVNGTGCKPCTILGCNICDIDIVSSLQSCTNCNTTLHYLVASTTTPNVTTCACQTLYYFNTTNALCQSCHYTCLTCTSAVSCATCSSAQHRTLATFCDCLSGYLQDPASPSNPTCVLCDKKCQTCTSSPYNCFTCDPATRYLSTNTSNSSQNTCLCNIGTIQSTIIYALCTSSNPICGDGILTSNQQCDDHNTNNYDGCNSNCQIQQYHACQTTTYNNGTSLCYYDKQLNMTIQSVLKLITDNKVSIIIKVQAILCNLDILKNYLESLKAIILASKYRRLLTLNNSNINNNNIHKLNTAASQVIYISSASFQVSDAAKYQGYLTLVLDYTEDISTISNKQLTFESSNQANSPSKYFFATPLSNVVLIDPQNNILMQYYQPSSYKLTQTLSYIFLVIACIDLLFFIILIPYKRSVVAIQNILIFQFAYFSIVGLSHIQLSIASMAYYGKYITGININMINNNIKNIVYISCNKMGKIYQQCNSIDNINITFYFALICIIVSIVILMYRRHKQRNISMVAVDDRQNSNQQNRQQNSSRNNNTFRLARNSSNVQILYELPKKINKLLSICLQYSYGIFFITAIQFTLTVLNLNETYKIISIAWLIVIFIFYLTMWVLYYMLYPLPSLSYVKIHRTTLQKLSIYKFAYCALFTYLLIWGAIVSVLGIAAYIMNIILAFVWLFLTIKVKVYRARAHQIRAIINQFIIICIAFIFIMLEYVAKDGLGIPCAVILLVLLVIAIIVNVGFTAYQIYVSKLCSKVLNQAEQLKQLQKSRQQQYSSRKKGQASQMFQMRDLATPNKRQPLVSDTKRSIKNKMDQLRTFKRKTKITHYVNPLLVQNNIDYNFDQDDTSNKLKDQDVAKMEEYGNL